METHSENIVTMLDTKLKKSITMGDLFRCHKEAFQAENGFRFTRNSVERKSSVDNVSRHRRSLQSIQCADVIHSFEEFSKALRGIGPGGNIHQGSSTSDISILNSGAEYDSGAQDLCDEPQSLHLLLKCENPELYRLVFPVHTAYSSPPPPLSSRSSVAIATQTRSQFTCISSLNPEHPDANVTSIGARQTTSESVDPWNPHRFSHCTETPAGRRTNTTLSSHDLVATDCPDWVRRLFNCANVVHLRQTNRLRSELRDLTRHLQSLQASRDLGYREAKRLQKERNQLRNELSKQVTRYEDRLTELHGVIAELRRRLQRTRIEGIPELEEYEERTAKMDRWACAEVPKKEHSPQACSVTMVQENCDPDTIFSSVRTRGEVISEGSTNGDTSVGAVDGERNELFCGTQSPKCGLDEDDSHLYAVFKTPTTPYANYGYMQKCDYPKTHTGPLKPRGQSNPNPGDIRHLEELSANSSQVLPSQHPLSTSPDEWTMNQGSASPDVTDCLEPDWVTASLNTYYKAADRNGKRQHDEQHSEDQRTWTGVDDSILTGPLSPDALFQFLHSISKLVPYPRLAEAVHCAQLTWSRLLTTVGRLQADCLVLQSNLAEAKATADRMQCQLHKIEANWDAAVRVITLAEACLEISDCLNQLYSTELAIVLHQAEQQTLLSGQAFSTLSSSTSSSSLQGRSNKTMLSDQKGSVTNTKNVSQQPPALSPPPLASCSPQHHPYAVYALPGSSLCTESCHTQQHIFQPAYIPVNSHMLKAHRHTAETIAHALVERFEMIAPGNDQLYPTVSSSNGTAPSFSLGRTFTRLLQQAPLGPSWFSTHSPLGHNVPSTQSLTSTSLYANSWYVSLGQFGRRSAVPTNHGEPLVTVENCAGSESLPSRIKVPVLNGPVINTNTNASKSAPMPTTQHPIPVVEIGRGWQTPDSGAGSSSTNEVGQQPLIFPTAEFMTVAAVAAIHSDPSGAHPVSPLDVLPPLWCRSKHWTRRHSIYDYDSDSSDSSEAVTTGVQQLRPQDPSLNTNNPMRLRESTWTRLDERKLRTVLGQLLQVFYKLKSTIIESPSLSSVTEDDTNSHRLWDSLRHHDDTGQFFKSVSFSSIGKRPLSVLLESAVLLQELCCVKEERADLKARIYLLEKELHANQLMVESHRAAESALRAHLDALTVEQNYHRTRQGTSCENEFNTISGQSETTLLRGQVRNLLQALEALRHSSELQQLQSEELVDDLKRANTALIGAFEKAKRKYLTRIKRLEDQVQSIPHAPAATATTNTPAKNTATTREPVSSALTDLARSAAVYQQNPLIYQPPYKLPSVMGPGNRNPMNTLHPINPVNVVGIQPSNPIRTDSLCSSTAYTHWNTRPLPAVPVNESGKRKSGRSAAHPIKTSNLRDMPGSGGEQTTKMFISTPKVS